MTGYMTICTLLYLFIKACVHINIWKHFRQKHTTKVKYFFFVIFSKYHEMEKVKNVFKIDTEIKVERVENYVSYMYL